MRTASLNHTPHSKNKKFYQEPFLVLQLVTNRGLVSVTGRTNQYLEGPQLEYWGRINT